MKKLNKKLIKQLANGEIAVEVEIENDKDTKKLNIIMVAVGYIGSTFKGFNKYYWYESDICQASDTTKLPTLPVKDFFKPKKSKIKQRLDKLEQDNTNIKICLDAIVKIISGLKDKGVVPDYKKTSVKTEKFTDINKFDEAIKKSFESGGIIKSHADGELIKTEEQPEAIDWNKPQLVINQYGTLIATTGENTEKFFMGVLIKHPLEHKVRYTSWNKEVFKPFKGTINIE